MARQPRFIEDDEPVVSRRRSSAPRAQEEKPVAKPANTEEDIPDVDELIGETDAPEAPLAADSHTITGRFDGDDAEPPKKGGKKIALLIVALLLGFAILGAGVYALVHFVLSPKQEDKTAEVTATEAPTIPEEPTLAVLPTEAFTAAPTEAATEPDYGAMADAYMKDMSDYDKLCQLFIVTPEVLTASLDTSDSGGAVTVAGNMTKESLEKYPVGGIIYFADNLQDSDQTSEMIENSQSYAKTPLFIAVDEEGGDVARVADKLGTKKFHPMYSYKDKGEDVAQENAETIGSNIRALGFNMDCAPVADVMTDPDGVIGTRAYSDDYEEAAKLVAAAVRGFNDSGVVNVLKHFPGHGATSDDSHNGLAYIETSVDDLKKNELLPFKSGIDAGADMVMVGHLVVNDLDPDMPATLSSKVVPELLRKELGYDGIVITDSLLMDAVRYNYDTDTIVKGLFAADADVFLMPNDLDSYIESIQNAVENGDITQQQIDAKVKKILTLKFKKGIMKPVAVDTAAADTASASENPAGATEAPAEQETADLPTDPAVPEEQPSIAA